MACTGAAEVWTGAAAAVVAVVFGGALVTGAGDFVTMGAGAAGWLAAGVCDGEAVPTAVVGLSAVVAVGAVGVVGGGFELANAMIMTMPTTAVIAPRRRSDQSGRNQSRITPSGKKKISKSTMETVRRCQGSVDCARDPAARCGEMTNSSSAIHSGQPDGGCGQDGSGAQSGGGDQPAGG